MMYEHLKRLLWPHFVLPLALLVVIDYLSLLSGLLYGVAVVYVLTQVAMLIVGFFCGAAWHLGKESGWAEVRKYNIVKAFPMIPLGFSYAEWILSVTDPVPEAKPELEAPAAEPQPAGDTVDNE